MIKKLLSLVIFLVALLILALGCWVLGLYLGWPLWRSVVLFVAVIFLIALSRWLYHRWLGWRLRRRLARPVSQSSADNTERLEADLRAGLTALKQSRLSRFGSPLYVLPWYMLLGPNDNGRDELLRRAAGHAPVYGRSDDPPVLQWWLLRRCVILDATPGMGEEHQMPDSPNWRRLLHWLMRVRRREPLNGLILPFNADWLAQAGDAELNETGQGLRKRLDELSRIYDARIPVYIVITHCQTIPGFDAWARGLGAEVADQAVGYLNPAPATGIGQFISEAMDSIVCRMADLRILQGINHTPATDAFGLPERMAPVAQQLGKVMRLAFQATPYAETPFMKGLFLAGRPVGNDRSQPGWFSQGLFEQALPAQRHAWMPLERWRHWRRFLRGATVVVWLGVCTAIAMYLVHASNIAQEQLDTVAELTRVPPNFSGSVSNDLHAVQGEHDAIKYLIDRPVWQRDGLVFQHRINQAESRLKQRFVTEFRYEVVDDSLNLLLQKSLPQAIGDRNAPLLAAWAQTLVRRINLIDAAIAGRDVYAMPAPGSELTMLMASAQDTLRDQMAGVLFGEMYRDYLVWETDREVLDDRRNVLLRTLSYLNLTARNNEWLYAWVDLQGTIKPVRMTDFWNISDRPDLPVIPAALTPEGESAALRFLDELGRATGTTEQWSMRRREFQQTYQSSGLDSWYRFAAIFPKIPDLLPDRTTRRTAMSALLGPNDPYQRLIAMLAAVGERLPAGSAPDWIEQSIRLDTLHRLSQSSSTNDAASAVRNIGVIQRFGGDIVKKLPRGESLGQGLNQLRNDSASLQLLQAYRQGVHDTIVPLQQGEGLAMKAAIDIWTIGHDPNVKNVPLINAQTALTTLRQQQGPPGLRTSAVWDIAAGPMNFVLDYAARNAGCQLQQQWDSTVLSAIQGVTDGELANMLLYGDRGQIKAFLDGDVKDFLDRDSVRYEARAAMGRTVPLNGQFFAFASMTQLRQVSLAGEQLHTKRSSDEAGALKQQQAELEKQIAKLQATSGTVTLSTVPTHTNPDARALPESVTLTLQCASGTIQLVNLNFPSSAVFPWSNTTCADATMRIHYDGFDLTRQWTGAFGFIDFLREFASGQRQFTPADFPDEESVLSVANIGSIVVTFKQQGQAPLVTAFNEADRLTGQLAAVKAKLAALEPGTAPGSTVPPPSAAPAVPLRILTYCMGPIDEEFIGENPVGQKPASNGMRASTRLKHTSARPVPEPHAKSSVHGAARSHSGLADAFVVQVGIFSHADEVRNSLKEAGYEAKDTTVKIKGVAYQQVRVEGYRNRSSAEAAAERIGALLRLKPQVIRVEGER